VAKFTVQWWITFWDHDPEIHYLVDQDFEADDLDDLQEILNEGIENDEFCPEDEIPDNFELGNLNIEYAIIKDSDGNVVFRDPEFQDEIVPKNRRL
jgi:hypothetical protein